MKRLPGVIVVGIVGIVGIALPSGAATMTLGTARTVTLRCADVIGVSERPESDGLSVVLGRVALPTRRALQANKLSDDVGEPWWAKQGLLVRAGRAVTLRVPASWRGRLAIGWGSSATPSQRFLVPRCASEAGTWLAFAGGYWVDRRACVPVVVQAAGDAQRVRIGVGAACPGQSPPPPPA